MWCGLNFGGKKEITRSKKVLECGDDKLVFSVTISVGSRTVCENAALKEKKKEKKLNPVLNCRRKLKTRYPIPILG